MTPREQAFLQSTRLFDGNKRKYAPKKQLPNAVSEWDQDKHEKSLRQFFYTGIHASSAQLTNFFTCPYCNAPYQYWSKHEPKCPDYEDE
jgi:hypothetical protein